MLAELYLLQNNIKKYSIPEFFELRSEAAENSQKNSLLIRPICLLL